MADLFSLFAHCRRCGARSVIAERVEGRKAYEMRMRLRVLPCGCPASEGEIRGELIGDGPATRGLPVESLPHTSKLISTLGSVA